MNPQIEKFYGNTEAAESTPAEMDHLRIRVIKPPSFRGFLYVRAHSLAVRPGANGFVQGRLSCTRCVHEDRRILDSDRHPRRCQARRPLAHPAPQPEDRSAAREG